MISKRVLMAAVTAVALLVGCDDRPEKVYVDRTPTFEPLVSYGNYGAPATNTPDRAAQQAACEEQAAMRRAGGVPSGVVWKNNGHTCVATGGKVETGKLGPGDY